MLGENTHHSSYFSMDGSVGRYSQKVQYQAHNLYNMDETGLALSNQHMKVITTKDAPYPKKISDKINECYTLVFCVSADGFYLSSSDFTSQDSSTPRSYDRKLLLYLWTRKWIHYQTNLFQLSNKYLHPPIEEKYIQMLESEECVLFLVDRHNFRDFIPSIIVFEIHRVIILVLRPFFHSSNHLNFNPILSSNEPHKPFQGYQR
jgi:hypothetical protein